MSSRGGKKPTEEEIAEKRRQRAEKKQREAEKKQEALQNGASEDNIDGLFVQRRWIDVKDVGGAIGGESKRKRIKIVSWNILAQGLVRRKLFPGSDCLKWKEREPGLCAEMRSHDWDIAVFQEVDKIEIHGPNLERAGRCYVYAKGYPSKQHGLMIAWRARKEGGQSSGAAYKAEAAGSKVVFLDKEGVGTLQTTRRGLSRVTRNIALFVALTSEEEPTKGIIVATTHLFWHPMHAYERVRQTGVLKRSLVKWRRENEKWSNWPMVLAGDFNDQPYSATYKLMIGEALTEHNWEEVKSSSVVHKSVDEVSQNESEEEVEDDAKDEDSEQDGSKDENDEENDEADEKEKVEADDDKMLKNCRRATTPDGLFSLAELIQLHDLSEEPPQAPESAMMDDERHLIGSGSKAGLISAYGTYYGRLIEDQEGNYFGSKERGRERFDDPNWTETTPNPHLGECKEPMWTLHSSIFALTLDYIFLFPGIDNVTSILPTHRTAILAPGVPRKGICASDHVAIGAEIEPII